MKGQTPKVSIGLPVYNGEKYLASAIQSLLAQTFTDFEVVVSDNASTDGTAEICRWYASRDARIRYYRDETNRGVAWNYARTFELARGEFFRWQAHDDICLPTLLECCLEPMESDPSVVLTYPRLAVIDSQGELLPSDPTAWRPRSGNSSVQPQLSSTTDADQRRLDSPLAYQRFGGILLHTVWCLEPYGLMRSDAVRSTGILRNYCGAEKVFLAEMALRGKFHEIPDVLFYVRRHAEQYSLLPSASAQRELVNPGRIRCPLRLPRQLRSTWGFLCIIPPASISNWQRIRCFGVLLRYAFQVSKWKRIVVNTIRDVGISDGYLKATDQQLAEIGDSDEMQSLGVESPRQTSAGRVAAIHHENDVHWSNDSVVVS
ncbi:MAG: glycosyltransferase family 2 protein [Pirellulales bacterium]|nr:glycosyltransferase family 2 protein [Pirellulales bacterium]